MRIIVEGTAEEVEVILDMFRHDASIEHVAVKVKKPEKEKEVEKFLHDISEAKCVKYQKKGFAKSVSCSKCGGSHRWPVDVKNCKGILPAKTKSGPDVDDLDSDDYSLPEDAP